MQPVRTTSLFLVVGALLATGCIAKSSSDTGVGGAGASSGGGGFGAFGAFGGAPGTGPSTPTGGAPTGGENSGGSGATAASGGAGAGGASGIALPAGCFNGASAECNPLTNAGCTGGAACDIGIDENQVSHLVCYPPPNPAPVGGACNAKDGPFCVPGSVCTGSPGTCVPFCCSNADCGGNTACAAIDPTLGTLGACMPGSGSGGTGGGNGGTSGSGGATSGHDLVNCTGTGWSTGTVNSVTPQVSVSTVQTDPSGNVKLILLPKASTSNGDVVIGVYFFAKPGQLSYPPNGSVGCAVLRYQNGWQTVDKSQMCEVTLSQLKFASTPGVCDGVMSGSYKGVFSGNAPLGGTFSVPLKIAASEVKPPSCQGTNGPCSAHSDCCSQSCSLFIGVCN